MDKRTLNIACGEFDKWGTDKLDREYFGRDDIRIFDLNSRRKLPFKKNTFDEIKCWNVIQILFYPQELINECYRILKPSGKLGISTLDSENIFWYFFPPRDNPVRWGKPTYNNGQTTGLYNLNALSNRLKHAGFKILSTGKESHRFPFNDYFYIHCKK